ncbi:MAG: hypothetical protein LBG57_13720 [Treponema sp.]|nr:hypothetical protein [Treponema sp.]
MREAQPVRGFPKISVLGKQPIKKACFAAFRRETAKVFPKLPGFWENLISVKIDFFFMGSLYLIGIN